MRSWKSFIALTLLVALLAPVAALARAYQTFTVAVPFEFTIGDRKFKPGTYIFVILGPGLMAVENARKKVITTLITRDIRGGDVDAPSRVHFEKKNGHDHLESIWLGNGTRGLEIVGEQVAMRQNQAPPPLVLLPQERRSSIPNALK